MGSTFTVVVIIVAALLACAAFGLALSLQTRLPPPPPPPPPPPAAGRQRLDGPAQTGRQAFAPPRAPKLREPLEASKAQSGKPTRFLGSSFLAHQHAQHEASPENWRNFWRQAVSHLSILKGVCVATAQKVGLARSV